MRVLITGGAGFVGSHLADACLLRGDQVFVLDDLSTGSIDNIEYLKRHPYFHYTIDRVQNARVTAELVDRVDMVYHLAAEVGVRRVIDSPISTIENNVQATEVVFSAAAKKGKRVLFTSTSEVYGLSTDLPYREDGNIVMGSASKGRWSYACSKALDEFLALAYYHERQMPVTVVRLFNTVGPRQTGHYGMVIPSLVQQAMTGKPITVFGDGSQSRCFGFVKDVVKALIALMERPEAAGEIYNIGGVDGDLDPRPREAREGADEVRVADRARPVRGRVRVGLRGHAAPRPRHVEAAQARRLRADDGHRRDRRFGDAVVHRSAGALRPTRAGRSAAPRPGGVMNVDRRSPGRAAARYGLRGDARTLAHAVGLGGDRSSALRPTRATSSG